jgi:uncharacterized protein (TIGR02246 family)
MTNTEGILAASARFYEALNRLCNGDPNPMSDAWWHDETVTVGHPMGSWVMGWDAVWLTWLEFSKALEKTTVEVAGVTVRALGDDLAYTTGTESVALTMGGKELRGTSQDTNIFRQRDGQWRLVHHHADKAPSFEAAV